MSTTYQGHAEKVGIGINVSYLLGDSSAFPIKEITIKRRVFVCCKMTMKVSL